MSKAGSVLRKHVTLSYDVPGIVVVFAYTLGTTQEGSV